MRRVPRLHRYMELNDVGFRTARMPEVPRATAQPQRFALGPTSLSSSLRIGATLYIPSFCMKSTPPQTPPEKPQASTPPVTTWN
jgi:hypothetical protein